MEILPMHSKVSSTIFQNEGKNEQFQLLFLKDDNYQSVEVVETQKIDIKELTRCLNRGESVFIKIARNWKGNFKEYSQDIWLFIL